MKQSYGRLLAARLMSPAAAIGLAAAALVGVSACHNDNSTPCPNLSQANVVIGQPDFVTDVSLLNATSMSAPNSMAVGSDGSLYVADYNNNRVLVYSSVPTTNGAAANFVLGQPCFGYTSSSSNNGDAGPNTVLPQACSGGTLNAYTLYNPSKVWISSAGQLVITDTGNNRVLIFDTLPTLAVQSGGKYAGQNPNQVQPDFVLGQPSLTAFTQNNGGVSASSLFNPTGAIVTRSQIAVADRGNNRVLIWNSMPTQQYQGAATNELGQQTLPATGATPCGSTTAFCFTSNTTNQGDTFYNGVWQTLMNAPTDVWSSGGDLYVSDSNDNRVLYYSGFPYPTQTGSGSSAYPQYNQNPNFLIGVSSFNRGYGSPSSGSQGFNGPTGLSGGSGYLFVADSGNNRVLQIPIPITQNQPAARYVFGQEDFSHVAYNDPDQNGQPGDQRNNPPTLNPVNGTLDDPTGVFVLPGQSIATSFLFVADNQNGRILIYPEDAGVDGTYPNLCS